jgi:hypothetical protein
VRFDRNDPRRIDGTNPGGIIGAKGFAEGIADVDETFRMAAVSPNFGIGITVLVQDGIACLDFILRGELVVDI